MKPHNHTDYQKRFFKEVKKQFPFYGKREKEYLKQFQTEIDAYLEEFPDSSYEAMLEAISQLLIQLIDELKHIPLGEAHEVR